MKSIDFGHSDSYVNYPSYVLLLLVLLRFLLNDLKLEIARSDRIIIMSSLISSTRLMTETKNLLKNSEKNELSLDSFIPESSAKRSICCMKTSNDALSNKKFCRASSPLLDYPDELQNDPSSLSELSILSQSTRLKNIDNSLSLTTNTDNLRDSRNEK